jgi:hypothetical protein
MFFRELHEDLGCASYIVADGGEATVVDPEENCFRIAHILDTTAPIISRSADVWIQVRCSS